jgi:hypothetical protein
VLKAVAVESFLGCLTVEVVSRLPGIRDASLKHLKLSQHRTTCDAAVTVRPRSEPRLQFSIEPSCRQVLESFKRLKEFVSPPAGVERGGDGTEQCRALLTSRD